MRIRHKAPIFLCISSIFILAFTSNEVEEKFPGLDSPAPAPADLGERYLTCAHPAGEASDGYAGYEDNDYTQSGWEKKVAGDLESGLNSLIAKNRNIKVTVIDIKRPGGIPKFKYLSNGTYASVFESWSSSKFIAALGAIRQIRLQSAQKYGSTNAFGANVVVPYRNPPLVHFGDLITWVHSYEKDEELKDAISNGIATWFLNIGNRDELEYLLQDGWLKMSRNETVHGAYRNGTGMPQETKVIEDKAENPKQLQLASRTANKLKKDLSTLTLAEIMKRLVTHEYLESVDNRAVAFPSIEKQDVDVLLYGNPHQSFGGMAKGMGIYMHEAFGGKDNLDQLSNGKWRIFSKLGYGYNRGGEFVYVGYACIPQGNKTQETIISMFVNEQPLEKDRLDDAMMLNLFKQIVQSL